MTPVVSVCLHSVPKLAGPRLRKLQCLTSKLRFLKNLMSMRTKRVQPARGKAPAAEPGESTTAPGAGGGDGGTAGELTLFREALDRFVRPLKEDVTDFETTILTSFLKQADGAAFVRGGSWQTSS